MEQIANQMHVANVTEMCPYTFKENREGGEIYPFFSGHKYGRNRRKPGILLSVYRLINSLI